MKFSKREKILLSLMGMALFGFLYYRFVFTSETKAYNKLSVEFQSRKAILQQVKNKDTRIIDINSQIEKLQSDIDNLQNKIAEPILLPLIINDLDSTALKNTVQLSDIQFSGNAAPVKGKSISEAGDQAANNQTPTDSQQEGNISGLKTLNISVSIVGTYLNCMNFIKYYENNKRLFTFEDVDIKGQKGICYVSLNIKTYSFKDESPGYMYDAGIGSGKVTPFE